MTSFLTYKVFYPVDFQTQQGGMSMCLVLTTLLCLVFSSTTLAAEDGSSHSPDCIHIPFENCPQPTDICKCVYVKPDSNSVICCHITSDNLLKESLSCAGVGKSVTALHLRNVTFDKLDASSEHWQYLVSLSVTDSQVPRLVKRFGSTFGLICLNFSNSGLAEIDPRVVTQLPKLSKLVLSHNNLTLLPEINVHMSHFVLDVSENHHLNCQALRAFHSDLQEKNRAIMFDNENTTFCTTGSEYHWFNSTELVSLTQLRFSIKVDEECPQGPNYKCSCSIIRLVSISKTLMYPVSVDCSNRRLTSLPKPLPNFTTVLNVSYNEITDLIELSTDPTYQDVKEFYADYNKIKELKPLESSNFLHKFVVLSVVHNEITSIPIYILNDALDRNTKSKFVSIAHNRIVCDCSTAQILKFWLVANRNIIMDSDQLYCNNFNNQRVIELDQNKVCVYKKHWSDYIQYIIALEILLLLMLISKVTYDYWVFKTTGYLPWPASKMPKLPCDWVFE
ncbi:protein halfway isoform X1 [Nilaparvata lugens]|uniref:protein halfway isoform X1 n=2 Tax=Nilaparvata lugens TaxID=108931 RepID=UPI000B99547A|nr:protein halfway isoform X1 [Nilaparvata lugens]